MLNKLKQISLGDVPKSLLFLLVFLPFLTLPFNFLFKDEARFLLLFISVFLILSFYSFRLFKRVNINIFFSKIDILLLILPLWYVVSSIVNSSGKNSFLGIENNLDSTLMIFSLSLIALIISFQKHTKENVIKIGTIFLTSLSAFFFLIVFAFFLKFTFNINSLSFFTNDRFIGSINDLSILGGAFIICFLLALKSGLLGQRGVLFTVLLSVLAILSLFFSGLHINFFGLVIPINILAIIFCIPLVFSKFIFVNLKNIRLACVYLLFLFLIFLSFFRPNLNTYFSKIFNINHSEVNLTWGSNLNLIKNTLEQSPIYGFGPNTFSRVWDNNKPSAFNLTKFWNEKVFFASGYIVTSFVTVGVVGFFLWCGILFFSFRNAKKILKEKEDNSSVTLIKKIISFLSLYFGIIIFFYSPGFLILYIFFVVTGLLSLISKTESIGVSKFDFVLKTKKQIIVYKTIILSILFLLLVSCIFVLRSGLASVSFSMSQKVDQDDFDKQILFMRFATIFDSRPEYFVSLSRIQIEKAKMFFYREEKLSDAENVVFNNLVDDSLISLKKAFDMDQGNFDTHLALGHLFFEIGNMEAVEAYENSLEAYINAINLSPKNPTPLFFAGRVSLKMGNYDLAKKFLSESIIIKTNYTESYFLLALNEEKAGHKKEAINLYNIARKIAKDDNFYFIQYLTALHRNGFVDIYQDEIEHIMNLPEYVEIQKQIDFIKNDKIEELEQYLII